MTDKPKPRTRRTCQSGMLHGETKNRINLVVTPTAISWADKRATELDLSRSEYIEQLIRMDYEGKLLSFEKDEPDA